MHHLLIFTIIVVTLTLIVYKVQGQEQDWLFVLDQERVKHRKLLDAIRLVETGGEPLPSIAVGDGGKARGWYQIHYSFYKDAVSLYDSIDWPDYLEAVKSHEWSERLIVAVWRRYRRYHNGTSGELATLFHNGGGCIKNEKIEYDIWYHIKVMDKEATLMHLEYIETPIWSENANRN